MASYRVELTRSAERDLERVDRRRIRERLFLRARALAKTPRPPGCEKMAGAENRYRLRVGDYRIVYEVSDAVRLVAIIKIGHRREVYR